MESREIREREHRIHCPHCGKYIINISDGRVSFTCERCHTHTVAICKGASLTTTIDEEPKKEV